LTAIDQLLLQAFAFSFISYINSLPHFVDYMSEIIPVVDEPVRMNIPQSTHRPLFLTVLNR
jgi:hypothetical protein